jgi:hypothetical protein
MLIERAAVLTLRLAKLDDKIVNETGPLTLHDTNYVIAWQNALTRCLKALGGKPSGEHPSLDSVFADIAALRSTGAGDAA